MAKAIMIVSSLPMSAPPKGHNLFWVAHYYVRYYCAHTKFGSCIVSSAATARGWQSPCDRPRLQARRNHYATGYYYRGEIGDLIASWLEALLLHIRYEPSCSVPCIISFAYYTATVLTSV